MSIARSVLVKGPAKGTYASANFFHQGDVVASRVTDTFQVKPDGFSQADIRDRSRMREFSMTPDGRFSSTIIAALWRHFNALPSKSMAEATDLPFVLTGSDGAVETIKCAICVQPPTMILSAEQTMLGPARFMGILPDNVDPDDADAYDTYATSGGTFTDSGFALTAIKTQPYTAVWTGVTGFSSAWVSQNGFTCETRYQYSEQRIDGLGVVDLILQGVEFEVSCIPVGPTRAQIMAASGYATALGASRHANAAALTITGADAVNYVTIAKATLVTDESRYSSAELRNGTVKFAALMNLSTGAQAANVTLAAS